MSRYRDDLDTEFLDLDRDQEDSAKSRRKPKPAKRQSRKSSIFLSVLLLLLTITTAASIGLAFYILKNTEQQIEAIKSASENEVVEVTYTQNEVDQLEATAYENGENDGYNQVMQSIMDSTTNTNPGIAEMLRRLFTGYVVCQAGEGFMYVPINPEYEASGIDNNNLIKCESGEIKYNIDGNTVSRLGIDVSEYQGEIDWEQVADYGVSFAIIRLGFRGYGSGKLVDDARYEENLEGATSNGIETGVYFFTQAITEQEIEEEVDLIFDNISGYNITGPIVIDIEKVDDSIARGNALSREERTVLVQHFCNLVREKGYTPMVYGNLYSLFYMLDIDKIHDEKIWFAFYYDYLYYPYKTAIWQYSDQMQIPGIKGNVDVDISFE